MHMKSALLVTAAALALVAPGLASAQSVTTAQPAAPENAAPADAALPETPETIIVTANRRNERATRIPYNISAIGEAQLREQNITDVKRVIDDNIAISAPQNSARFNDSVTVRGLNVSPVNANNLDYFVRSTLSYYLDDTPLPNIGFRIKDIDRVESLIGPQGTLYGAGALGGVIRYITNRPELGQYEGAINASIYQTQGGGLSNDTDIVLNIPLGNTMALRGSFSRLDDAGYTDRVSNPPWFTGSRALTNDPNPGQNLYKDDDWTKTEGGRIALRWQPIERLDLQISYSAQDQLAHGTSGASRVPLRVANARTPADLNLYFANPGAEFRGNPSTPQSCGTTCSFNDPRTTPYAVNDQTIVSPYEEFADRSIALASFDLDYDFGWARLHSSTAQYTDDKTGQADYFSQGFAFYCDISFFDIGGCLNSSIAGNRHAVITFNNNNEGLVHETRLVSTGTGPISWIAGLYYSKTEGVTDFTEIFPDPDGAGPGLGLDAFSNAFLGGKVLASPNPDEGYFESFASVYTEAALFGEVTWAVTPRWRVMAGGRIFNYEDESERTLIDYSGDFISETIANAAEEKGQSYFRFNTAYDLTPNLLAYFTASQGFRRGGSNPFRDLNTTTRTVSDRVATFGPDSTDNLELGLKGSLFGGRLYVETNIYQILWRDTQTYYSQSISGFPVNGTINGPDSISRGWEFSSRYRFNDNWSVTFKTALAEAEWNETENICTYEGGYATGLPCGGSFGTTRAGRTYEKGGSLGGIPAGRYDFGVRYQDRLENGSRIHLALSGSRRGAVQEDRCDTEADCQLYEYPEYTRFNLSAGWSNEELSASFWVRNLTNVSVPVSNQAAGILGYREINLTPMTLGLNLGYRW
ncbi:MAG: TonB-dependent receptor [Hyphomonadaceae bacterium]|nr:TonB-dependent receptor [Hyphomonadaceae bacterium]